MGVFPGAFGQHGPPTGEQFHQLWPVAFAHLQDHCGNVQFVGGGQLGEIAAFFGGRAGLFAGEPVDEYGVVLGQRPVRSLPVAGGVEIDQFLGLFADGIG